MSKSPRCAPFEPADNQPDGFLNGAVCENGSLFDGGERYVAWMVGSECVTLDSAYTADDLEAIAAHMRTTTPTRTD
tara:strand:+ start:32224 stop:32451 length:228 start_codon:yes stop_codon:yes gene_type:complete